MDPNANVQEQRYQLSRPWSKDRESTMVDLRGALRAWLRSGGFAPDTPQPSGSEVRAWALKTKPCPIAFR